jgi:transcription elongation factor GreB
LSKAFTSEEAAVAGPVIRAAPRLAPGEVRLVTPEGHARMRESLARLLGDRPALLRGDAPDRAARLAEIDARAAALEGTLAVLTVLGPEAAPAGEAAFGAWVTVKDAEGRRNTWRIVGPDEADPREGTVSVSSPVARALLGKRPGDGAAVQLPGGARELVVVAVSRAAPGAE